MQAGSLISENLGPAKSVFGVVLAQQQRIQLAGGGFVGAVEVEQVPPYIPEALMSGQRPNYS